MGFSKFIGKLFGSKQTRDIREIQPWVDKIKRVYPRYEKLSNDELRAATLEIKQKVRDFVIPEKQRIEELKATVEQTELEDREPLFNQIDKMENISSGSFCS
jgi:preprotein translocase subunit SecA